MNLFDTSQIQYTGGRIAAVVGKPALLFLANNYFPARTAQGLAIAFLFGALGLVAIAADPHRQFYAAHFTEGEESDHLLGPYATSILLLGGVGSLLVVGGTLYSVDSLVLGLATALYFLSEKLRDEVLRFRLFERAFGRWGRSEIAGTGVQFAIIGGLYVAFGSVLPASLTVLALAVGNFAVYLPQIPGSVFDALRDRIGGVEALRSLVGDAARLLYAHRLYWMLALLSASIGYMDRVIALVANTAILPLFMLVVMCFTAVQMSISFFYVSRHRQDFLQRQVTVKGAFTSREFLGSLGLGLGGATVATVSVLLLSENGAEFPLVFIASIAALQVAIALTNIPRNISYWIHPAKKIMKVDGVFWGLFGLVALAGWQLNLGMAQVLPLAAAAALVRLVLHVWLARRTPNQETADEEGHPPLWVPEGLPD